MYYFVLIGTLIHLALAGALDFQPVQQPNLQYDQFGNRIGFFGSFEAISFYSYINASAVAPDSSASSNKLYLRDPSNNNHVQLASVNGHINQLLALSSDSVVFNGNYTQVNGQQAEGPIIYNITSREVTPIISSTSAKRGDTSITGDISTLLVDNHLIYLGGNFEFNNTYGAAIYNTNTKSISSTPFQGFGANSSVNAISKIFTNDDNDQGSIIFGGHFNTLGLRDLLTHNTTTNSTSLNHTNSTNTSLISAEQIISLKHGTFSNVNSDNLAQDSALICPAKMVDWSLNPGQGGQWLVELPDEMKGITPTKARIFLPEGSNSVKTFRIYSYPNNGIMNLSYVDPKSNQIRYCDAWCPLLQLNDLEDITLSNAKNATELSDDDSIYVDDNGSYYTYYDPSTRTKTLGYGANYQEFSFENEISVGKVGVTIIDWYGSQGVLSGFQLFLNQIIVYGNNSLNEPNCDEENSDAVDNASHIDEGNFQSVKTLNPAVQNTNYLVSQSTDAKITLYPNISYSGNYSIIMNTPGCIDDGSCNQRSIVNVTVIDNEDNQLSTKLIYQNNDYYKFDYLFYGHLNGSSESNGQNRIEISFHNTIVAGTQNPWTVVDKVTANIVGLDQYFDMNSTNSTNRNHTQTPELTYISLNGLFEYSLSNFTGFNEVLVSSRINNRTIISPNNTFVGNSSINLLSGQLTKDAAVSQIRLVNQTDSSQLLVLGHFESESKSLTLSSKNLITLNLKAYNTSSNQTEVGVVSRDNKPTSRLSKRAAKRSEGTTIYGASLNSTVSNIVDYRNGLFFLGNFGLNDDGNSSVRLSDISNNNQSISTINNFAFFSNNDWYGFGNSFSEVEYSQFSNITINDSEFYIFSSNSGDYKIWNTSSSTWADSSRYQLNVSQALQLNSDQQILSGGSFNIMDFYSRDQAYSDSNTTFGDYNINITDATHTITESFYVNSSLSVVGGKFTAGDVVNIGFIGNNSNQFISALHGSLAWSNDSLIQTIYVDSNNHYLFVGFNGTVQVNNQNNMTGVLIYDLKNNTIADFQPSELSNDSGDLKINSIVLYDKGNKLLVGGNFDKAGSLDCVSMCVFDIANTRWINPATVNSKNNNTVAGEITDIKFYQSNEVLIGGNLTINDGFVNFITYNFDSGVIGTKASLNKLGEDRPIEQFIINDSDNTDLNARMVAYGDGFVSGFDGNKWTSIDDEILFSPNNSLGDIKLLPLSKSNSNNNGTFFDKSNILALAGKFDLRGYGTVNVALFNGTNWIPYIYTTTSSNQIGEVNSLLILDAFRFQSSDDISNKSKNLSKGKVVGISLACALGSTTLLGLLYIIPYFALFRSLLGENNVNHQRIQENEMMDAVNPEELFHEIDLQRNH